MPRVVANQRERFENDELFRKLSRDLEVRYTGFRDRPITERRLCLQAECRDGHATIAIIGLGLNLNLSFYPEPCRTQRLEECSSLISTDCVDFTREPNKVHLKSHFILNGVCVTWKGWLDLRRLDGVGRFEYDAERAQIEDALLREDVTNRYATSYDELINSSTAQRQFLADRLQQQQHRRSPLITGQQNHTETAQQQFDQQQLQPSVHHQQPTTATNKDDQASTSTSCRSSTTSSSDDGRYVMCYDDVSN
jgi:hypothetical protein